MVDDQAIPQVGACIVGARSAFPRQGVSPAFSRACFGAEKKPAFDVDRLPEQISEAEAGAQQFAYGRVQSRPRFQEG